MRSSDTRSFVLSSVCLKFVSDSWIQLTPATPSNYQNSFQCQFHLVAASSNWFQLVAACPNLFHDLVCTGAAALAVYTKKLVITGTTCNKQEMACIDLKLPTTSKKLPGTIQNEDILRLFYNIGQSFLFSKTFSTQYLIAFIRALFHGESW